MPIKKNELITFIADHLKRQNFSNIRARDKHHPSPKGILWEKGAPIYYPDLTAHSEEGMGVFSMVENPEALTQNDLERFKLFSFFAEQREGKHFLVTENSRADELCEICREHLIRAEILSVARSSNS